MLEKIDCTDCGFFGFLVTFQANVENVEKVSISLRKKARKASSASVYYFVLCLVAVKYNRQGKSSYRYSLEKKREKHHPPLYIILFYALWL